MRTMFRAVFGLSLVALVASPAFAQGRARLRHVAAAAAWPC